MGGTNLNPDRTLSEIYGDVQTEVRAAKGAPKGKSTYVKPKKKKKK
jgi:hypothetical protein